MERFLLYLDNLDDVFFALRFVGERRRQTLRAAFILLMLGIAAVAMTILAPPGAAAGAAWLIMPSFLLLYRAATLLRPVAPRT